MKTIEDFNGYSDGGSYPVAYWADWDGDKVIYGGDWQDIPNMPAKTEPSLDEVWAWRDKYMVSA